MQPQWNFESTGTPPITLFFGPGKIYRVIRKTVLKEERFRAKWEIQSLKNGGPVHLVKSKILKLYYQNVFILYLLICLVPYYYLMLSNFNAISNHSMNLRL